MKNNFLSNIFVLDKSKQKFYNKTGDNIEKTNITCGCK